LNPIPVTVLPPSPSGVQPPSTQPSSVSPNLSAESGTSRSSPPVVPHRIHPNNTHYMATRGKYGIVQKRIQPTLLLTHIEPTSYKEAIKNPEWLLLEIVVGPNTTPQNRFVR